MGSETSCSRSRRTSQSGSISGFPNCPNATSALNGASDHLAESRYNSCPDRRPLEPSDALCSGFARCQAKPSLSGRIAPVDARSATVTSSNERPNKRRIIAVVVTATRSRRHGREARPRSLQRCPQTCNRRATLPPHYDRGDLCEHAPDGVQQQDGLIEPSEQLPFMRRHRDIDGLVDDILLRETGSATS